jgi:D-alanyl-D-alanine carboxypeptidase
MTMRAVGAPPLAARVAMLLAALLALMLAPDRSASAAPYADYVVDAASGEVLHQDNAHARLYPASLTKMMTLYMLFRALDRGELRLDEDLAVSAQAARQPPSKLGLAIGSHIKVEDAILALVTESANDVAVVVGEGLGGTESHFAEMMTQQARALGMTRTTFRNASGLPNTGQVSTAHDMAVLARAILRDYPQYYPYFSTRSFRYRGRVHTNHNRLMSSYEGMDGFKTGYIRASGFNLVASAVRGDRRLVAVVFGGRTTASRNARVAELLDDGFASIGSGEYMAAPGPAIGTAPANVARAGRAPFEPPVPPHHPGRAPVLAASAEPGSVQLDRLVRNGGSGDADPSVADLIGEVALRPLPSGFENLPLPGQLPAPRRARLAAEAS